MPKKDGGRNWNPIWKPVGDDGKKTGKKDPGTKPNPSGKGFSKPYTPSANNHLTNKLQTSQIL